MTDKLMCMDCNRPAAECICFEASRQSIMNELDEHMRLRKENRPVVEILAQYDAKNHNCCRCSRGFDDSETKKATMFKYGAFFCSEECAERASDYTLDDGQQVVPDYLFNLDSMHTLIMSLDNGVRDLFNDNLRDDLCACTPESDLEDIDRLINATALERAKTLARTLKTFSKKKKKK